MNGRCSLALLLLLTAPAWAITPKGNAPDTLKNGQLVALDRVKVDTFAGVDCTGATDSTAGVQAAFNSVNANGQLLWIPSQCTLGLASPTSGFCLNGANVGLACTTDDTNASTGCGTGALGGDGSACGSSHHGCCEFTALTVPKNVHIHCEDQSAGFFAQRQFCSGGTYGATGTSAVAPAAACNTSAECLGSGICKNSFGATTTDPCTAATCFAPTATAKYALLRDATAQSSDVVVENCSLWTFQADGFQRCVGGSNAGDPCRQECDGTGTTPVASGSKCEASAACAVSGGTCLRLVDCATPGGTCSGAPHAASGAGSINPLDLARTLNARLFELAIWDHFTGDYAITTGAQATLRDVNVAREITDGTSPLPSVPTASTCFTTNAGQCNYGAFGAVGTAVANVQPTVTVTNGVSTGRNSQMLRVWGRGTTAAMTGGDYTRIDESTVWPPAAYGPGTASNGFRVGIQGQVAKSQALDLASGATGITLTAAGGSAIENRLSGAEATGISMTAANQHAEVNEITALTGAATGINIGALATYAHVSGNYLDGQSTAAALEEDGAAAIVQGNVIISTGAGFAYGIKVAGFGNGSIVNNYLNLGTSAAVAGMWLSVGSMNANLGANTVLFATASPTAAAHPIHVLLDGGTNQTRIVGNLFSGGWRGVTTGTATTSFNTNIIGNRFVGLGGASIANGGAGNSVQSNYFNANPKSLSCDPSCGGGRPSTQGTLCLQDSDCTANGNTCASAQKCNPEPIIWLGAPAASSSNLHPSLVGNLIFGPTSVNQCGGTGPTSPGARCTSTGANGGCAGGGTCTGGSEPSKTCVGGTEAGTLCCTGGGSQTCASRVPVPIIRVAEYTTTSAYLDAIILGNQLFNTAAPGSNAVSLDMVGSGSLGHLDLERWNIAENLWDQISSTNTTAIKLPTSFVAVTGISVGDNNFKGFTTPASTGNIANYQGSFGSLLLQNGVAYTGSGITLGVISGTQFFPFNGGLAAVAAEATAQLFFAPGTMTIWKMTCQISAAPGGTSTRVFPLRVNTANTTMTCTIGSGATSCTTAAGSASAPIAVTAGQPVDYQIVNTLGTSLAAASGSCVAYASHDTAL